MPFILFGLFMTYYISKQFNQFKFFNNLEERLQKVEPWDFKQFGPFLFEASERKFMNKLQSRKEYHEWLDNDIRRYG